MLYSGKQIVTRIKSHVKRRGGTYDNWFVGVSAEPRTRLFENHSVQKSGDFWILVHAESSAVAEKVKAFLARKLGMAAQATELADRAADFVYAYRKTAHTRP